MSRKIIPKELIGMQIMTKNGKKLGTLKDFIFDIRSGEVIHMVLTNPTQHAKDLNLEQTKNNEVLVPWNSLLSIEDFIVVNDEDLI